MCWRRCTFKYDDGYAVWYSSRPARCHDARQQHGTRGARGGSWRRVLSRVVRPQCSCRCRRHKAMQHGSSSVSAILPNPPAAAVTLAIPMPASHEVLQALKRLGILRFLPEGGVQGVSR